MRDPARLPAQLSLDGAHEMDDEAIRAECRRVFGPDDMGAMEDSTVRLFIGDKEHVFRRRKPEHARRAALEFLRGLPTRSNEEARDA